MRISRRILAGLATASLAVTATSCGGGGTSGSFDDTVTVGILPSLSGTMAISESTLVDTEKMAIEEITQFLESHIPNNRNQKNVHC